MERGERGGRRENDEGREHKEEDERSKEIDEFVERWEREREIEEWIENWEHEDAREQEERETSENQEDDEGQKKKEYQEDARDCESKEHSGYDENKESEDESKEAHDGDEFSLDVDEAVRDAIRELEEEAREEAERQEAEEGSKEPNEFDELEERMKEVFEGYGVTNEEMEARWKEGQEVDMEEELAEKNEDTISDADETKNGAEEGSTSGESAEGEFYHESGEGTVYAMNEGTSSESQESTTESELDYEEQKESEVKESTNEESEVPYSETPETTEQKQRSEKSSTEGIEGSESQETKKHGEDSKESSERREGNENKEQRENQGARESAESKAADTLEQSERNREGDSSKEDEFSESESREYIYSETDSEPETSEQKNEHDTQSESTTESESSEQKEMQNTEKEEVQGTKEEEESEEDTEKKELDDSEPSPNFPEGFPEEPARMLPDEFNVSLFPYPDEHSEKELTEEESEEVEEFLRALEDLTEDRIETIEELERAISENQDVMEGEYFEEDYERAVRYLEFMQKVKETYTEEELEEKNHYEIAKELGYKSAEVSGWLIRGSKPTLIERLEKRGRARKVKEVQKEINENQYRIHFFEPNELIADLKTKGEIEETLLGEFPGLRHQKHIERVIHNLSNHVELIRYLDGRESISKEDLKDIASKTSISLKKVRKWVLLGQKPVAYTRIDDATRSMRLGQKLLKALGSFTFPENVKQKLAELDLVDSIEKWKKSSMHWKHLEKYYRFLSMLLEGTLRKDIIRILGIKPSTSHSWCIGHLPYPIRLVVKPDSVRSEAITIEHQLKLVFPSVLDIEQLVAYIRQCFPGILQISHFEELIKETALYLMLAKKLSKLNTIRAGELGEIAKSIGIYYSTARRWVLEGSRPEIYYLLNQARENMKTVEKLRMLLPFHSTRELESALKRFYLASHLSHWNNFKDLIKNFQSYLKFLHLYERGYTQEYIAKKLNMGIRTVYEWTRETLPLLPYMLQQIPKEELEKDWYWLPLYIEGRMFSGFIQVPKKVDSFNDLQRVMHQFQDSTLIEEDFMYLLGVLASDGYIAKRAKTSYSLRILLSKKYKWSKKILKSGKDILSSLGLDSSIIDYVRKKDEVSELTGFTSPFFIWVREAVLGLEDWEIKSYDDMRANWLISLPDKTRLAFLQGFADGDGYATFFAFEVAISSLSNRGLLRDILASFGINPNTEELKVSIKKWGEIITASKLPLFRHARTRKKTLDELAKYAQKRLDSGRRSISKKELDLAIQLRKKGMSIGRIIYAIWRKFGTAIPSTTLARALKKDRGTHKL